MTFEQLARHQYPTQQQVLMFIGALDNEYKNAITWVYQLLETWINDDHVPPNITLKELPSKIDQYMQDHPPITPTFTLLMHMIRRTTTSRSQRIMKKTKMATNLKILIRVVNALMLSVKFVVNSAILLLTVTIVHINFMSPITYANLMMIRNISFSPNLPRNNNACATSSVIITIIIPLQQLWLM